MARAPIREPGTGTQIATFASPESADDGRPNSRVIDGRKWECGRDYIDTERGDVCELIEIQGRSTWCDTRPADEQPPILVFQYERWTKTPVRVDPFDRGIDFESRYIDRYQPPDPRGH